MKNSRLVKKISLGFCCLLLFCAPSIAADQPPTCNCQSELFLINAEIAYLEKVKARYLALVLIHEEQAMRWQFDPHLKQEARRSLRLADAERRVIQEIQERIENLCIQRDNILRAS